MSAAPFRGKWVRVSEPRILFPVATILLIAAIWGTTFTFLRIRYADAAAATEVSTRELLSTYEAQVGRAVREIEQAINLVQAWPQQRSVQDMLSSLADRELLPSHLVFTVNIASREGDIVASTQPAEPANVAQQDYFRAQLATDALFVGVPSTGGKLHFSRS